MEEERIAELEKENASLRGRVARLSKTAVDRSYMLNAYREMLGPIALQVADGWESMGVTRQHTSWGPEAHKMTGEERAKVLLDAFSAQGTTLDFRDSTGAA